VAYYRTRIQMTKTVAGRSFVRFIGNTSSTPRSRTGCGGLITIHAADSGSVSTSKYLKIANFDTAQASSFYTRSMRRSPAGARRCRKRCRARAGSLRGKLGTGLTNGIPAADDPMQSSCQRISHPPDRRLLERRERPDHFRRGDRQPGQFQPLIVPPYNLAHGGPPHDGTYGRRADIIVPRRSPPPRRSRSAGKAWRIPAAARKNNNKRIRDILTTDTETITVTDGVQTSDITVLNSLHRRKAAPSAAARADAHDHFEPEFPR